MLSMFTFYMAMLGKTKLQSLYMLLFHVHVVLIFAFLI